MPYVGWVAPVDVVGNEDLALVEKNWSDAANWPLEDVQFYLDIARDLVIGYAPAAPVGVDTPLSNGWKLAQIMWARHQWSKLRTGNADRAGTEGTQASYSYLEWDAKRLIRPPRSPFKGLR